MHPLHEKGTNVKHIELNPKIRSAATGLFARLRALLRGQGSGAPASGRGIRVFPRAWRVVLAVAVVVSVGGASLLVAPISSDASPPELHPLIETFKVGEVLIATFKVGEVNATRATILTNDFRQSEGGWSIEYSASSPHGPWTLVASKAYPNPEDRSDPTWFDLHGLVPETHYYLRAVDHTSNERGREEEKTSEFTTTAVAAPVFYRPRGASGEYSENENGLVFLDCDKGEGLTSFCGVSNPTTTSGWGGLRTEVYADGADTNYHFEYSTSKSAVESGSGMPLPGVSGSLTAGEEYKVVEVPVEGLAAETKYYLRAVAENGKGEGSALLEFETHSARPSVNEHRFDSPAVGTDPTASTVRLIGSIIANRLETHWWFEYASEPSGPWHVGVEGIIAASALTEEETIVEGEVGGLSPGKSYYVRLRAESEPLAGHPAEALSEVEPFHTSGPPAADTFAVHALHGEALRLLGYVQANDSGLNDVQRVSIAGAPTGGSFTLTSGGVSVTATGTGDLIAGETGGGGSPGTGSVFDVKTVSGEFRRDEPISGAGIPAGTIVTSNGTSSFSISNPASATANGVSLTAGLPNIPFDSSSEGVREDVEELPGFAGNVLVSGRAGGPYTVEFVGGWGVRVGRCLKETGRV